MRVRVRLGAVLAAGLLLGGCGEADPPPPPPGTNTETLTLDIDEGVVASPDEGPGEEKASPATP